MYVAIVPCGCAVAAGPLHAKSTMTAVADRAGAQLLCTNASVGKHLLTKGPCRHTPTWGHVGECGYLAGGWKCREAGAFRIGATLLEPCPTHPEHARFLGPDKFICAPHAQVFGTFGRSCCLAPDCPHAHRGNRLLRARRHRRPRHARA
jgi:hypothetical protein